MIPLRIYRSVIGFFVALAVCTISYPEDDIQALRAKRLEFNGLYLLDGSYRLSFHDPYRLGSFWLALEQGRGDISLISYDPAEESAILKLGEVTLKKNLKKSTVEKLALNAVPRAEIHEKQIDAIYGNEELVRARLEVVIAREEKEHRRRMVLQAAED